MSPPRRRAHGGFTLAEILAAMAVITIALVAMAAALHHSLSAIETGGGESTAVFLVEDKLEALRSLAVIDWANVVLEPGTTVEYCQASGVCAPSRIPGSLRRTTTIAVGGDAVCSIRCKVVTVSVFYRPLTALGQLDQERRVDVHTMFVARA